MNKQEQEAFLNSLSEGINNAKTILRQEVIERIEDYLKANPHSQVKPQPLRQRLSGISGPLRYAETQYLDWAIKQIDTAPTDEPT